MGQQFLDPLYGRINPDAGVQPLIFSSEFQRLRYVRLCNINSLYLTGASEPKRFEHCIGVYHLARLWSNRVGLSQSEARILCAAALLHDLQTGPFGHSFQYVLEDNAFGQQFEHANLSKGLQTQFHQRVQAGAAFTGRPFSTAQALGVDGQAVFAAIRGEGPFGPLISGTLDLDNLDNVVRLAFHTGLCSDDDRTLPERLTSKITLVDGRLAITRGAHQMVRQWLEIRRELYEYLLLDRGEFSAKAMLTLAIEMAVEAHILGPDSWLLTDDELLSELEETSVGEHQAIGQIVRRLRVGDLFEPIGVWSTCNVAPYEELSEATRKRAIESRIEQFASMTRGPKLRCCVHFIKDHKKTRRSVSFLDAETGASITVGEDSCELHVGVFIVNDRVAELTGSERLRYERAALRAFAEEGLDDLVASADPLSEADDGLQRELFSA